MFISIYLNIQIESDKIKSAFFSINTLTASLVLI